MTDKPRNQSKPQNKSQNKSQGEIDDELVFMYFNEINIIAQLSSRLFRQVLPAGLTMSQFTVLNWFVRVDSIATPGRLAKALQVTGGAMTNTLNKLEDKRLVDIRGDPDSGRSKLITLTAAGRELRDAVIRSALPLYEQITEVIGTDTFERQIDALRIVRRYLDDERYRKNSPG